MARSRQKSVTLTKTVPCTHCGAELEVTVRTMSMFCPHCQKRVILEDFTIKTYHAVRQFITCGDVVVEKGGTIAADVKAGRLTVHGKVWGNVEARRKVEIDRTGYVRGLIRAPRLTVADGASLVGHCDIRPDGDKAPAKPGSRPPRSQKPPPKSRTRKSK